MNSVHFTLAADDRPVEHAEAPTGPACIVNAISLAFARAMSDNRDPNVLPTGAAMVLDEAWNHAFLELDIPDDASRRGLIASADVRLFDPNTTIIAQDDNDDFVYLLLEGSARVVLLSESGQEIWIDAFGAGAVFGELATLTGQPRTTEIIAETECRLACYNGTTFTALMNMHGPIALSVARLLARRINHTTQRMFELSAMSATGRVYAELLRMSAPAGSLGPARQVRPAPSMIELARRVNTTRETASRTVNALERQGLLRRSESALELVDPELLQRMAVSS